MNPGWLLRRRGVGPERASRSQAQGKGREGDLGRRRVDRRGSRSERQPAHDVLTAENVAGVGRLVPRGGPAIHGRLIGLIRGDRVLGLMQQPGRIAAWTGVDKLVRAGQSLPHDVDIRIGSVLGNLYQIHAVEPPRVETSLQQQRLVPADQLVDVADSLLIQIQHAAQRAHRPRGTRYVPPQLLALGSARRREVQDAIDHDHWGPAEAPDIHASGA